MKKPTRSPRLSKPSTDRPDKPYDTFPLYAHPSGKWAKKINGKLYYFGRWNHVVNGKREPIPGDGWKDAFEVYKAQADDLPSGRTPRAASNATTVKDVCNAFLNSKLKKLQAGELSPRSFTEYHGTTDRLVDKFGNRYVDDLTAIDFETLRSEIAKQYGPHRLSGEILRVRTIFKYAFDVELIEKPVRYGPEFKKPSKTVMRRHRANSSKKLFLPLQVRRLINAAGIPLKAMILLGVNCAYGNSDCGSLPLSSVDLDQGWITFPRPKTGIERRAKLWPETIAALREAIEARPTPKNKEDADILFITKYGHRWVRTVFKEETDGKPAFTVIDSVCLEFGKLTKELEVSAGFYAMRHTFRTVADATKDFPAVRLVMGHADNSIDDVYREEIDDDRLVAVANHVHDWLCVHSPEKKNGGVK